MVALEPEEYWSGKTVVVAGATGFFGGWLIRQLIENQANVVAIVHSPRAQSQFYLEGLDKQTTVEQGNVYDSGFMSGLFQRHQIDFFFHAAYGADVNRVLSEPLECFRSSVESTWLLLDLVRQARPECVTVVSSSDKAYGSQSTPYRESQPLSPMHPYEVAKASQDLAAQSFGKTYHLPIAVTRCANYFGPFDFNYTRLVPSVCKSLAEGEPPVLRSDGHYTRDFLYIEDAVDAHLLLARKLASDDALYGEAFNFSYSSQVEVIELVRKITGIAGVDIEPVVANDIRAEIRDLSLSSEKAISWLGWRPKVGFEAGLVRTTRWYLDFLNAPRTG